MTENTDTDTEAIQPTLKQNPEQVLALRGNTVYEYFRFTSAHQHALHQSDFTEPASIDTLLNHYSIPDRETAHYVQNTLDTAYEILKHEDKGVGLYYRYTDQETWRYFDTPTEYAECADAIHALVTEHEDTYLNNTQLKDCPPKYRINSAQDLGIGHKGIHQLTDDLLDVYTTLHGRPAVHELARYHVNNCNRANNSTIPVWKYAEHSLNNEYPDTSIDTLRKYVKHLDDIGVLKNAFPTRDIDPETHPQNKTQD